MTLAEHYKGRDISIVNSNVLMFLLIKKKVGRGSAVAFYQETGLILAYFSCSQNKPLLSSSHNRVQQHTHLQRQPPALTIHAGHIVKPYRD